MVYQAERQTSAWVLASPVPIGVYVASPCWQVNDKLFTRAPETPWAGRGGVEWGAAGWEPVLGPSVWMIRTWRVGVGYPAGLGPGPQCPGRFQELKRNGSWESSGLFPSS